MSRQAYDKINKELIPIAGLDVIDSTPIQNSNHAVSSGGVYSELKKLSDESADIVNVLGAKNLLPNNATTRVNQGVTFTVNSDGSITANGTANSEGNNAACPIVADSYFVPTDGEYIISGNAIDGNESDWTTFLNIYDITDGQVVGSLLGLEEKVITLYANHMYRSTCGVLRGKTVSSSTCIFYPMIRPASIKDDTYVPYAPINRNCSEKTDLANIRATGSTNNTGAPITSGTYFYLNNILVVAIQNISNGASFTRNTNYEEVTAGALNKKGGVNFNRVIASFTGAYTGSPISGSVDYTLTEDSWLHIEASIGGGYLQAFANVNKLLANWANYVSTSAVNFSDWVLLPKGTRVTMTLTPDTNKVYSWSLQFYAAF